MVGPHPSSTDRQNIHSKTAVDGSTIARTNHIRWKYRTECAVRGLGVEGFFDFCVGRVHEVGDDRKELENVKTIPLVRLKVQAVARDAADSRGQKSGSLPPGARSLPT